MKTAMYKCYERYASCETANDCHQMTFLTTRSAARILIINLRHRQALLLTRPAVLLQLHYYCSFCHEYCGTEKPTTCANTACLLDFTKKGSHLHYFIVIPFLNQLQAIIRGRLLLLFLLFNLKLHVMQQSIPAVPMPPPLPGLTPGH